VSIIVSNLSRFLSISSLSLIYWVGLPDNISQAKSTAPESKQQYLIKEISADADVVALGIYEAEGAIHGRGIARKPGSVRITGKPDGKAVVLVLSAYEPVNWHVDSSVAGRVKGAILFGYYPQSIFGLNRGISIARPNIDPRTGRCRPCLYAYRGGPRLDRLFNHVVLHLGRPIDKFLSGYRTGDFDIDAHRERSAMPVGPIAVPILPKGRAADPNDVPEKDEGLEYLLKRGDIRRATKTDMAVWRKSATDNSPSGFLAPYQADYPYKNRTYVIQRQTIIPEGLYGGQSVNFIIPKSVSEPVYRDSHNGYYFEKDGSCKGRCPAKN